MCLLLAFKVNIAYFYWLLRILSKLGDTVCFLAYKVNISYFYWLLRIFPMFGKPCGYSLPTRWIFHTSIGYIGYYQRLQCVYFLPIRWIFYTSIGFLGYFIGTTISYIVKENHIGSADSKILWYRQTHKDILSFLLFLTYLPMNKIFLVIDKY